MSVEVLVVDDDAAIRRVIAAVLEDEGYRVCLADHGREALDRIAEYPPQLVVLDLQMPVMSGWELHEELRACHPGIPVVFMTAGGSACSEARRHGADGYLAKPFDLTPLLRVVEQCAASAPVSDLTIAGLAPDLLPWGSGAVAVRGR